MSVERDFPTDEQRNRKREEAPCVRFHHEKERREHHGIIPVVNPAGAAAFVFEKPRLKRAEKQDANHITDSIRAAYQQHDSVIKKTRYTRKSLHSPPTCNCAF